jgi:hypothetical protein
MPEPSVTLAIVLSTDEATDFAVLLSRLNLSQISRFSWRGLGDTELTVANWGLVLTRLQDEMARLGYPAVRA